MFRDVHRIATRYHWSEEAILRLSLKRRRVYLSLIEADDDEALFSELGLGADE
ncbi:MAG: hypothetical protein IPK82_35840 [Polyangiaceae bacterium]|nr:hypothetical protein [Polyangiaceae bacterium]